MDWNSDSKRFQIAASHFELVADPNDLKSGIAVSNQQEHFSNLLSIKDKSFVESCDLTFRRGSDVFTVFQRENHSAECYWRLFEHSSAVIVLESIVSLRSSHLETEPFQFELQSRLAGEISTTQIDDMTIACSNHSLTALFLIHPDDSNEVRFVQSDNEITTVITVPLLERGVMRRIRTRVCLYDTSPDESDIRESKKCFEMSEIPLTT